MNIGKMEPEPWWVESCKGGSKASSLVMPHEGRGILRPEMEAGSHPSAFLPLPQGGLSNLVQGLGKAGKKVKWV